MYATYHLSSAQEITTDILEAIKVVYKSRSITWGVKSGKISKKLFSPFFVPWGLNIGRNLICVMYICPVGTIYFS